MTKQEKNKKIKTAGAIAITVALASIATYVAVRNNQKKKNDKQKK